MYHALPDVASFAHSIRALSLPVKGYGTGEETLPTTLMV